ncbi:hypothetical protein DICPUDRAFT_75670 [Dictyostelium purpureum]|uniref:Mitochondrial substrate carrier family protein n=1 Tax=Dictyostelium purpureum TaxID=5786 RepID=F0ZBC0_DICPU|nr:uncharacterized protein DICPUDRAFT_75670 [Dictyostelium purpureum]EGC38719.1 hypothetical protein DICPUDRAFT_75670 [Dictyostelium purpureum]|eukprot:XP_003284710.1 hypothetical protein DICPUDRAFT_75670 [Dictyostelium purpureum]
MSGNNKDSQLVIALKDIVAGSVGGIGQVFTGHPLDTIKVRLQTQPVGNPIYSGTMDCLRKTIQQEGFMGLYKGVASPLVGLSIMNSVMFLAYGQAKTVIQSLDPTKQLSIGGFTAAGALAGVAISFVDSPVDLFKSQMQVQSGEKKQFSSTSDCARQIWKIGGVRGVFQGLGATFVRDIPANAFYFGAYEYVRKVFATANNINVDQLSSLQIMAAGGAGGVSYWTLSYPADVVKSTMQTDSIIKSQRKYSNMLDCAQKIYKQQGIAGFYKGFTPCFIRSIPANAACFVLYEKARQLMG